MLNTFTKAADNQDSSDCILAVLTAFVILFSTDGIEGQAREN